MAIKTGDDVIITIGGANFSTEIESFSETGGEKTYAMIRSFGNNYEQVLTGYTDYEVEFKFRLEDKDLNTLFNATTVTSIVITDGNITTTYYNMLPKKMNPELAPDDLTMATMSFVAPAYDKANTRYNRVLS